MGEPSLKQRRMILTVIIKNLEEGSFFWVFIQTLQLKMDRPFENIFHQVRPDIIATKFIKIRTTLEHNTPPTPITAVECNRSLDELSNCRFHVLGTDAIRPVDFAGYPVPRLLCALCEGMFTLLQDIKIPKACYQRRGVYFH